MGDFLYNLGIGKDFLTRFYCSNSRCNREKTDKFDYIKIDNFGIAKTTINKVRKKHDKLGDNSETYLEKEYLNM